MNEAMKEASRIVIDWNMNHRNDSIPSWIGPWSFREELVDMLSQNVAVFDYLLEIGYVFAPNWKYHAPFKFSNEGNQWVDQVIENHERESDEIMFDMLAACGALETIEVEG